MGEPHTNFRVMTTCTYTEITFESHAAHRTVKIELHEYGGVRVSMNLKNDGQLMAQIILLIKLPSQHASRAGRLEMKARGSVFFFEFLTMFTILKSRVLEVVMPSRHGTWRWLPGGQRR